jgi:hypothetical protein
MGALDEFLNSREHRRDYADARIAEAGDALSALQEKFKQGGLEAERLFVKAARVFWKRDGSTVMRRFIETQFALLPAESQQRIVSHLLGIVFEVGDKADF